MNELTLRNFNGIDVVDSRQVAEAVGKEHYNLLKDIAKYREYLGAVNFDFSDFFVESTYITEQNKEMPCYLCTRKGCEMIANKLTGKKGVVFTALYINAFHKMEKHFKQQNNYLDIDQSAIIMAVKELCEQNCELNEKFYNLKKENHELNCKIDQLTNEINRLNHEQNKNNREFTAIIKILCEKVFKSRKSKSKKHKFI